MSRGKPKLEDHLEQLSELREQAERLLDIVKTGESAETAEDAFQAIIDARDEADALSGGATRYGRRVGESTSGARRGR